MIHADEINDAIDYISDLGIDEIEQVLTVKALMAITGSIAGPWAFILTPLIHLVLRKCGIYKLIRFGKRSAQYQIDLLDGNLILTRMNEALSSGDLSEIKNAYNSY